MNAAAAKQIDLVDFLVKIEAKHCSTKGNDAWFLSPIRFDGKEPSFKVNVAKNIWYDHVAEVGGTIIDLIMNIEDIKDVEKALQRIDEIWNNNVALSPVQKEYIAKIKSDSNDDKRVITIKKVVPLKNVALLQYLESRKLSFSLAKSFIQEIYYSIDTGTELKNYFGLAFENRSGGYEVRNAYSKTCIGKKDISIIQGTDHTKVSVFEGFLSFVSMLKVLKISEFKGDVIVMNSVSQKQKTLEYIERHGYETVYSFLDNDVHGQEATEYLFNNYKGNFFDSRKLFAGHKDPNELLMGNPIS